MSRTNPISAGQRMAIAPRYGNAAEWVHALGDIPLSRIVLDPWPGTATEEDLLVFVERDKRLCELVDGTLVEKPMGYLEGVLAARLVRHLGNVVEPARLGFVSGPDGMLRMLSGRVRLPDVAFVSRDQLPRGKIPNEPIPTLAPVLAIEVLRDSNTAGEMQQKLREYFESGCRLAWVIDPRSRSAQVYQSAAEMPITLTDEDTLSGEDVVPGFALRLGELFADL